MAGALPGRAFSRETLLSRVWGYEYFGGAGTVAPKPRILERYLWARATPQAGSLLGAATAVQDLLSSRLISQPGATRVTPKTAGTG